MKITHILWSLCTGGIETMLVDIINEQVKTGEISLIIINDLINSDIYNNISKRCHIYTCSRRIGSRDPVPIFKLNCFLYKIRPDIIHIHLPGMAKIIFYPWAKLVRTIHNTGLPSDDYSKCDALFAISNAVMDYTASQGYSSYTVYNGIHTRMIKKRDGQGLIKRNVFSMVQVSRLYHKQKGQDILIHALSILRDKYRVRNFQLHFIGEGESLSMLQSLVEEYCLTDNVCFLGLKDRGYIYQHLSDYDLFIQPSRYEGFGLTVAEAMAAKIPVLVSDIEGPMEIVQNGKFGAVFKNKSAEDLANKLSLIIAGSYDSLMIDQAYRHVSENYDICQTANRYMEYYSQLK